jgi:metal-dependent amidase/aminoacylase/carboxypeptidase family protein
MDVVELKQAMCEYIDAHSSELVEVSRTIHAHPEEKFAEHQAHDLLCAAIERSGLGVERHAFELPTAFRSRAGSTGPDIAVLLEYDALPGLGHACGHNIIAAAGLGAGLAAAAFASDAGGRVTMLGSPAEEGGGGKVFMIERGALDEIDAAMMIEMPITIAPTIIASAVLCSSTISLVIENRVSFSIKNIARNRTTIPTTEKIPAAAK